MSRSDSKFGGKFGADPGDDPFAGQDPFASVPDVDERLADWVDGTMSSRDRERFEAEMRVSPHLREQVSDYEATVAAIHNALNGDTHETNLADRVMASLAQEASAPGKRRLAGWPLVWAVMSAAALLGIAILIDTWGGTMLTTKPATGTVAYDAGQENGDQENEHQENRSTGSASPTIDSNDRGLASGAATSTNGERSFEAAEDAVRGNSPVAPPKKQPGGKPGGNPHGLAGGAGDRTAAKDEAAEGRAAEGKAAGSKSKEISRDVEPSPANKLDKNLRRENLKVEVPRGVAKPKHLQLPVAERGGVSNDEVVDSAKGVRFAKGVKGSVPPVGAPAAGGSGGRAAPQSPQPTAAGPSTGGPTGRPTGRPGGPTTGGPGGARAPSAVGPGGRGSQPRRRGASGSRSSDVKRRKGSSADGATRGRAKAPGRSRAYLMRLSESKSTGELLPLVTLEGLALASERSAADLENATDPANATDLGQANESPADEARRGVRPRAQTGSDDFYLGSTRRAQSQVLREFFDTQMRSTPEWSVALRERAKIDQSRLERVGPEAVDPKAMAPNATDPEAIDTKPLSIGGLQLFAVGPADGTEEAANLVRETKSKRLADVAKTVTPGEWDANGGAVAQRDWLVVGPRSEVAKLLLALRQYSDAVNTSKCSNGEVRLVKPQLRREGRTRARRGSSGSHPAAGSLPTENGPGTKPRPAEPASPLPAAKAEPTQRVVIRFRVRR